MLSVYNKKREKLLSTLICFALSFASFSPTTSVFAAEKKTDAQYSQEQEQALQGLVGKNDSNIANMIANGGEESVDEMESAIQKENAKLRAKKDDSEQQKNATTNAPKVYTVTRDGSIVTVTENPCYQVSTPTQECPVPTELWNISSKNSKGVYENRSVPKSTLQYIASDGKEIDGKMMNMIYAQKNMDIPTLNSDGTVSQPDSQRAVMSTIAVVASELGKSDLSSSQKFMLMMFAYQNAIASAKNAELEAMKADEDTKIEERKQRKELDKIQEVQKERNVIKQSKDFPYFVRIDPKLPTITDGQNVQLTLMPKKSIKNASTNHKNGNTRITVSFVSQENEGRTETLEVEEGKPFIVEMGNNPNRSVGERTIRVTVRTDNNSMPKNYSFSYTVSQYRNVLASNGKTVSNSVAGVMVNADLAEFSGDLLSVAGKVVSAKLDNNGQCRLRLQDGIGGENSNTPQMDILTNAVSQGECESLTGTYANFGQVSVHFNESTGRYEMLDQSNSTNRSLGVGYEGYMQIMDLNAEREQNKVENGFDIGVVKYDKDGNYNVGLAGAAGVNWTNINGTNISVYTDSDGNLKFGKPSGEPYSDRELRLKSAQAGFNLDDAIITKDDQGMLVVKTKEGTQINKNEYTKETFHNLSRGKNAIGSPENLKEVNEYGSKIATNGGVGYTTDKPSFVSTLAQQAAQTTQNIALRNTIANMIY